MLPLGSWVPEGHILPEIYKVQTFGLQPQGDRGPSDRHAEAQRGAAPHTSILEAGEESSTPPPSLHIQSIWE